MSVLIVKVLEARGLPDSKYSLSLTCGSEKKSTRVLDSKTPKWNESCIFPLDSASTAEGWDLRLSLYESPANGNSPTRLTRLHLHEADLMGGTAPLWHAFEKPLANGSVAQVQLQITKEPAVRPLSESVVMNRNGAVDIRSSGEMTPTQSKSTRKDKEKHREKEKEKEKRKEKEKEKEKKRATPAAKPSEPLRPPEEVVVETRRQPAEALLVPQLTQKFKSLGSARLTHSWELDAKELEFVRELGEGTSAKVFSGLYRGQEVAIKVLKDRITDSKILSDWAAEFNIMSMIRSPHVVFFYGATLKPMLAIVLELCQKGSLLDAMNSPAEKNSFTWTRVLKLTEGALKGILCLHGWKPQLVHRDLKSLNLLVDDNWNVKVGDFGLSRVTEGTSGMSTLGKLRGTYAYCAPEVYSGQSYSTKADIYSMAIVLWELVSRCLTREYQQPYAEYPKLIFPFQIIVQTAKNGLRPTIPDNCPRSVVDLLQRSWDAKPDDRPSAPEFIERVRALMKEYEAAREQWDQLVAAQPYSLRDRALNAAKGTEGGGLVHPPSFYE